MNASTISYLKKINACTPAIVKVEKYRTKQEAWDNWKDPADLMWLLRRSAGKYGTPSHRKVHLCLYKFIVTKENRKTLKLLKKYSEGGDVTAEEMRYASAFASTYVSASFVASASAFACASAYASTCTCACAFASTYVSASFVASVGAYDRKESLRIIRKMYPKPPRRR